ncbi:MAG: efflux RND transporter periplasmic adaptor subunit [Phycisphaerales bacterium]|nr:efflux RND transporter periplasmic adaptor subunit [Phycisphaerales bacterium]
MNQTPTNLESLGSGSPDVPLPRRRWALRFGLPLLFIGAAAALLLVTGWQALRPVQPVDAVAVAIRPVETNAPMRESGGGLVQAPGWVEADPFSTYVAALTSGIVEDVLVLEGDQVEKGQVVARLVADDARLGLKRARAILAQREGELVAAKAAMKAADTELRELVALKRREAVAIAETARLAAELAAFPAKIAQASAAVEELRDEYERKARLVDDGAVAAGPVERLRIRVKAAEAALVALDAEEQAVKARHAAAMAEETAARRQRELLVHETLEAEEARAKLLISQGALESAQVAVDEASLMLERTNVISPIKGVVIERLTSPGSTIEFGNGTHGAHVVHLYDPKSLQVRADVPLAEAAKVGVGQPAEIVVDLLPDTVFKGEVTRFVHRADISKNTVEAKVRIIDPSPLLKPDMLARVRILSPTQESGHSALRTVQRVFAPMAAIDQDGRAWVIQDRSGDRGTAQKRELVLGQRQVDQWQEIIEGLEPGDVVILDAGELADGQAVRMNSSSGGSSS